MSEIVGIPHATVKSRIFFARKQLARFLVSAGFDAAAARTSNKGREARPSRGLPLKMRAGFIGKFAGGVRTCRVRRSSLLRAEAQASGERRRCVSPGKARKMLVTGRRAGPLEEMLAEHANIASLVADAAVLEDAKRTIDTRLGQGGHPGQQRRCGCNSFAGRCDSRSDQEYSLGQRARPELADLCGSSSSAATRGTIINVSSTFGHKPAAGLFPYAASNAALEHLTRAGRWNSSLSVYG
jgi:NAD(P)-dependent dehydrogenase (short-subunit alcohol dehydrogenase family)